MPSRFLKNLAGKFTKKEASRMALSLRTFKRPPGMRIEFGYYGHPYTIRLDFWSCGKDGVPTKEQPEFLKEFVKQIQETEILSGQSRTLNWTWDISEPHRGPFGWYVLMKVLVTDNVAE